MASIPHGDGRSSGKKERRAEFCIWISLLCGQAKGKVSVLWRSVELVLIVGLLSFTNSKDLGPFTEV